MKQLIRRDSLMTVTCLTALAAGYYFGIYRPGNLAISLARRGIATEHAKVRDIPARVAKLESLQREIRRREDYLRDAAVQIPTEADHHKVIEEVTRLSKRAEATGHFKIQRLEPLPRVSCETYDVVPFHATLTGEFASLAAALTALESNQRLFVVRDLSISQQNEKTAKNEKMDVNFAVYVFRDENPDFSNKADSSAATRADSSFR